MLQLPDTLDVDSDTYPSDERLEQIASGDAIGEPGRLWMLQIFPILAGELAPYAVCRIEDGDYHGKPVKVISFSTSGWSGCEDFIDAVLRNLLLNAMYYAAWRRGGHFVFEVPACAGVA
jgi:hypothetical protein